MGMTDLEELRVTLLGEMKDLRASSENHFKKLEELSEAIYGNGREGISDRLLRLETKIDTQGKSSKMTIVIIGMILSVMLSTLTLVMG